MQKVRPEEFLSRASEMRIAIIGDYIQDAYIYGCSTRLSPEAPVPVVDKQSVKESPGGAGNVMMNLENLSVDVLLFTTGNKYMLDKPNMFVHPGDTPIKTRIMVGNHHLMRIDEDHKNIPVDYDEVTWRDDFEKSIDELDVVIFSDYHKGSISDSIARVIIQKCMDRNIPVLVDAKKDYDKYFGASVIKCNQTEWINWSFTRNQKHYEFIDHMAIKGLVVTKGAQGIHLSSGHMRDHFANGHSKSIIDVCGAGDTVTAVLAVCMGAGIAMEQAIEIANALAAEVCTHPGVYAIMPTDVIRIQED